MSARAGLEKVRFKMGVLVPEDLAATCAALSGLAPQHSGAQGLCSGAG